MLILIASLEFYMQETRMTCLLKYDQSNLFKDEVAELFK